MIFGIGFATLLLVLSAVAFPAYASVVILSLVLGIVLVGWAMRPQGFWVRLPLGPISETLVMPCYEGQEVGEIYPQLLIFRIVLKRLYLLALPMLAPSGALMWMFARGPLSAAREAWDNPVILYLVAYGSVPIFIIATAWFRERWLMSRGLIALGGLEAAPGFGGKPRYRYEFIGPNGERYGGMYRARFWRAPVGSNFTPVLVDKNNFDKHLPATALLFHRFELIDRQHLSQGISATQGT